MRPTYGTKRIQHILRNIQAIIKVMGLSLFRRDLMLSGIMAAALFASEKTIAQISKPLSKFSDRRLERANAVQSACQRPFGFLGVIVGLQTKPKAWGSAEKAGKAQG